MTTLVKINLGEFMRLPERCGPVAKFQSKRTYPKTMQARSSLAAAQPAGSLPDTAGADDARVRGGRLVSAMRTFFAREGGAAENEERPEPSLYERIGHFLDTNQLDATPSHYELAHAYLSASDPKLVDGVDRSVARDGRLTAEAAEQILVDARNDVSAELLSGLVDQAQSGLAQIAGLVKQSGADAKEYGRALETSVADLAGLAASEASVRALVELTGSMIEKTRAAEQQLRDTGKQMNGLRSSLAEARRVAESDALTGLANRRAFDAKLRRAVVAAREGGQPLSLAFCDIDHFKQVNDTHGHDVGDRILKFFAQLLSAASKQNCYVARHGGEEFVMLFLNREADDAFEIVDEIRRDMGTRRLIAKQSGEPIGQVTFSAGIASLAPGENGRQMLRAADQALYRAKRSGRDRVLLAEG